MDFYEKTISSDVIFTGKVFTVKKETVILPDGKNAFRELVCHNGGAAILALDDENNIFLVRQYRKGADCQLLEIPAGKLEAGEEPRECAIRELEEEIGATAKNVSFLQSFYPTPAYCSEKISIYFAKDLTMHSQKLDEGEFLEIVKMPFEKAYEMVLKGEITDGKTTIAILRVKDLI